MDVALPNQIDYILCSRNIKTQDAINNVHTRGDHRMVRAKLKINTKLTRTKLSQTKGQR